MMFVVHIEIDLVVVWHASHIIEVRKIGVCEHGQFLIEIEFITGHDLLLVRLNCVEVVNVLGEVGASAPVVSRHNLRSKMSLVLLPATRTVLTWKYMVLVESKLMVFCSTLWSNLLSPGQCVITMALGQRNGHSEVSLLATDMEGSAG